eukprot:scaffold6172_cov117-Isochrysis_galbana.AAC.3
MSKDNHVGECLVALSGGTAPVWPWCGSMIVPWGAVGPTTAVGVYKPPHAPERGMGRWKGPHT